MKQCRILADDYHMAIIMDLLSYTDIDTIYITKGRYIDEEDLWF